MLILAINVIFFTNCLIFPVYLFSHFEWSFFCFTIVFTEVKSWLRKSIINNFLLHAKISTLNIKDMKTSWAAYFVYRGFLFVKNRDYFLVVQICSLQEGNGLSNKHWSNVEKVESGNVSWQKESAIRRKCSFFVGILNYRRYLERWLVALKNSTNWN